MKKSSLVIVFLISVVFVFAQEQNGYVKTIGRPDHKGEPLENVVVRVQGTSATSVSDNAGSFSLVMAHYSDGQAYSLSRVSKSGYQLADAGVIGRLYPFSTDIPLEISMISNEDYYRTKSAIEEMVREKIDREYQAQINELKQQLKAKTISEENHRLKFIELTDYYDNTTNLIDKLADRYARIDYDRLDSIDSQISCLIEQGKLDEAEQLIQGKGTKRILEQQKENNLKLEQALSEFEQRLVEGRKAEAEMLEAYASELIMRFDIASMRFDNPAAAAFLKERMELDTTNVEWMLDYAEFIRDYLGKYDEAMGLFERALSLSSESLLKAEIYNEIGVLHQIRGQFQQAIGSIRTSIQLCEADDMGHGRLATRYHNLASIYVELNDYENASSFNDLSANLFQEFGDSLGLANVYNIKASICKDFGDLDKAKDNLLKALDIRKSICGELSLPVATIYANLANVLEDMGMFDEAKYYALKSLEINKQIYGENHPKTADDYFILGSIEVETASAQNSLANYEKAMQILTSFYGDVHPSIALGYNRLGYYYNHVKKDLSKAIHYVSMSVDMMVRIYGRVHANVAQSIHNLGALYAEMADYDKAWELYNEALQIKETLYGSDHVMVGDSYNNMAALLFTLGKYKESMQYFEKALEIYVKHFGESHHSVALVHNNMGSICHELNDDQTALSHYEKALNIYIDTFGEKHPTVANTYDNIGGIFYRHSMYEQAEKYFYESYIIRKDAYGNMHDDITQSLNNLALLYQQKKEYEKSEKMFLESYEILCDILGENHPRIATLLNNLSTLNRIMGDLDKALQYAMKAYDILEDHYAEDHPQIMMTHYGMAILYAERNEYENAIQYLLPVYYDSHKKVGPNDKYTYHYFNYLHMYYTEEMSTEAYNGGLDNGYAELNFNTAYMASVAEGSLAEKMGYSGSYMVVAYEDWSIEDNAVNFFVYNKSVSDRPVKTYVLYRDGDFYKIPFEGLLGIQISLKWIDSNEKKELLKNYKKWARKNK